MLVARQRVADQDRVALGVIESAVGLVGDAQWGELDPGVHRQRLVGAKTQHETVGRVGLARAVDQIETVLPHALDPSVSFCLSNKSFDI